MKKLLLLLLLAGFVLLKYTNIFASLADCPTLASFKTDLSFTAAGMVPATMPYYDQFAGYSDPYWESNSSTWVVLNNKPRISDAASQVGRAYMTVVAVGTATAEDGGGPLASTSARSVVLRAADAALAAASASTPTYSEMTEGTYRYELCTYAGSPDTMTGGTAFAELMD